jgi:Asp-tRNA(Asn)/Glu-tRNA(Gln) amidotransferase A subunit family amidase
MNIEQTKDRLSSLSITNKQFHHMVSIPSADELDEFNKRSSSFFGLESENSLKKSELIFTVKDIFNTELFPTEMGSKIWKGFNAGNNARVISMVLNEGHTFIGKTVTSEFAVHKLTDAINPWDPERHVGTSSSGSAISVLLKECDYSLCTQSGASISRPSSYLGIYGVKPTFGLVPRTGVLKTCDPLDTIGFMTKDISNASEILRAISLTGNNYPKNKFIEDKEPNLCIVGYFDIEEISSVVNVSSSMVSAYNQTILKLKDSGVNVLKLEMPDFFKDVHKSHEIIYSKSLEYYFKNELELTDDVSESFKEFVNRGSVWSSNDFMKEQRNQLKNIQTFSSFVDKSNVDFILSPAVHGVAPMLEEEELNDLSLLWTYLHCPSVTIPVDKCEEYSLPLGLNLSASRFNDINLINFVNEYFDKRPYDFSVT